MSSYSQRVDLLGLGLAAAAGAISAVSIQWLINNWPSSQPDLSSFSSHRRASLASRNGTSNKPLVSAICFDMDGTLIETKIIWFKLLQGIAAEFNYPEFTYEQWLPHFGQSMEANVASFFPGLEIEVLNKYCNENYHKYLDFLEVIPGAEDILRFANEITLDQTYLVTNCPRTLVELIINSPKGEFIKTSFASRIICAGDEGYDGVVLHPKPAISMITEAAHRLSISSHEIILVGDTVFDVEAITNAGGLGIHLGHGVNDTEAFLHISSLSELYQLQHLVVFPSLALDN